MDRHLINLGERGSRAAPLDAIIPSFLLPDETGVPDEGFLSLLPSEPFILFVGALLPQKGIWPLLGAYRRLRDPAPPLVLLGPTFYNSPTDLPPGVLALGATSHATVMAAWERAAFGVVPSVGAETFGNVVTEAMSQGRAVVASRLGGIVDIIEDEVSGLLVPAGDEAALAGAMQRLLDDDELRSNLGYAARERVKRFEASRVLPQFEALYRQLVSQAAVDRGEGTDGGQGAP
jgi:glycosyltransferase involved in cell wall biosynthesis